MGSRAWGPGGLTAERKSEVTAGCERLLAALRARYLPQARRDGPNHPVDIRGRWRGESYGFAVRFRSSAPETEGAEFDAPFARVSHSGGQFAVDWMRHTGRWWPLRDGLTLEAALQFVAEEPILRPPL